MEIEERRYYSIKEAAALLFVNEDYLMGLAHAVKFCGRGGTKEIDGVPHVSGAFLQTFEEAAKENRDAMSDSALTHIRNTADGLKSVLDDPEDAENVGVVLIDYAKEAELAGRRMNYYRKNLPGKEENRVENFRTGMRSLHAEASAAAAAALLLIDLVDNELKKELEEL